MVLDYDNFLNEIKHQFKIGDRVIWGVSGSSFKGTIIEFTRTGSIGVEFDKNIGGHDCGGLGQNEHCYRLSPYELRKEEPNEEIKEEDIIWF